SGRVPQNFLDLILQLGKADRVDQGCGVLGEILESADVVILRPSSPCHRHCLPAVWECWIGCWTADVVPRRTRAMTSSSLLGKDWRCPHSILCYSMKPSGNSVLVNETYPAIGIDGERKEDVCELTG